VEHKPDARASAERVLSRFLTRTGRRVFAFKLLRGLAFGLALGLFALLVSAILIGPSVGVLGAALSWSGLLLLCVVSTAVGVGRLEELSGPRRALLLTPYDARLSQRVRSAAELLETPNGSPELISEMLTSVTTELSTLPFATLVPRPRYWGRTLSISLSVAIVCGAALQVREDVASGLYAMTHPLTEPDERGGRGLWVLSVRARITAPREQGGQRIDLLDPTRIEVPEGSIIELFVRSRVRIERALLRVGERTLPFTTGEDGSELKLTAESSGALSLLARVGDTWVEDATARSLVVEQDGAPEVLLDAPLADVNAAADEPVSFVYRARDDHGLSGIELVLEFGPGRQRRVRLLSMGDDTRTREHEGNADVVPSAFGMRSGQTMAVWIEARDSDAYGGPNVGRSPVRTITVGSAEEGRAVPIELLTRARDGAIDTLADRLEAELPNRQGEAQERSTKLAKSTREFVRTLGILEKAYQGEHRESPTTLTMRDMLKRVSRLLRDEKNASEGRDMREVRRADEALVRELEDDSLWLTDLLGREKLNSAETAIERLSATRARMEKLLAELKKTGDPARKAELLAEVARARAELSVLAQRLAEAQSDVPADFVNLEALKEEARHNPLDEIEAALKRGDLAAAEKALAELDADMRDMQQGVAKGSESFASARFAPRNEAIERARGELSELLKSQKQLASETGRIAERARARSEEDPKFKAENKALEERAEALEKRVRKLSAKKFHATETEAQAGAAQRMRDARDALHQQNPREAEAMAERASEELESLANELTMDARMFPGPDGKRFDDARAAQELADESQRLAEEIARNVPRGSSLSDDESETLKKKAPGQRGLSEKTDELGQKMRENGPPGMSDGLSRSSRSMKKATSALEQGDVREAEAHQRDAVERLNELNEQMERQGKAGKPRPNESEGEGGENDQDERVAIPKDGLDARRKDLRRRVLDARRAEPPRAFESAVDRYYQEILR
jgi:Domain of unknown function (DUF4175)